MENADGIFLGLLRGKALQQAGAVHGGKACAVDAAVQVFQNYGFNDGFRKNMDVCRPVPAQPNAVSGGKVVVAGGDEDGNAHICQNILQGCHGGGTGDAVKEVTGQEHHVAVFCLANGSDFFRNPGQSGAQQPGLFFGVRLHGRIQMPVAAV